MAEVEHLGGTRSGPVRLRELVTPAMALLDDAGSHQLAELFRDSRSIHAGNRPDVTGHQRLAQAQLPQNQPADGVAQGRDQGIPFREWYCRLNGDRTF